MKEFAIKFRVIELEEIEDLVNTALQCSYVGDFKGVDMSNTDPRMHDLDLEETLRLQSILKKTGEVTNTTPCPECRKPVPAWAAECLSCGCVWD